MKKEVRPMNLESFCSVSRSSQKWAGTLLFLSSSKGSLLMQQDGYPPSQIRMAMVVHKKLNLESSICAFLQGICNPNHPYRWLALLERFCAAKRLPKGDTHTPKPASLIPLTRPPFLGVRLLQKGATLSTRPPLHAARLGAHARRGEPTQGLPRSGRWVGLGLW